MKPNHALNDLLRVAKNASLKLFEVIAEVRSLDQDRLNEEVLHGFSSEIVKKYWTPKPFIKPHCDAKVLMKRLLRSWKKKKRKFAKKRKNNTACNHRRFSQIDKRG